MSNLIYEKDGELIPCSPSVDLFWVKRIMFKKSKDSNSHVLYIEHGGGTMSLHLFFREGEEITFARVDGDNNIKEKMRLTSSFPYEDQPMAYNNGEL